MPSHLPGHGPRNALLDSLADLVAKPVLATLSTPSCGPRAIVRARLRTVETIEDYGGAAYLLFAEHFHGTRVVLPIEGLLTCDTDGQPPDRTVLSYRDAEVELKDISPEAIVRHYRRVALEVLALPPGRVREAQLSVLLAMAKTDVASIDDPLLVAELEQLIDALDRTDDPRSADDEGAGE